MSSPGTLFLVGTPIGNLGDLTDRARQVLGTVDRLACESISSARRLMAALELKCPPLESYREEERERSAHRLLEELRAGRSIALISEAGMPGISDPGRDLVERCHQEQIPVTCVPGATSVTTALALSGLPNRRWCFEGFLPRSGKERRTRLAELGAQTLTVVLLEAPNRVLTTLRDLAEAMGDRPAYLGRELTKRFEENLRGSLTELHARLSEREEVRGEVILVVGPPEVAACEADPDLEALRPALVWLGSKGLTNRDLCEYLERFRGLSHRSAYRLTLTTQDPGAD